jgi:hypothetical protein
MWFITLCIIISILVILLLLKFSLKTKKESKIGFINTPGVQHFTVITPNVANETESLVYDFDGDDIDFYRETPHIFVVDDENILLHDPDSQNVHDNKIQRYITTEYNKNCIPETENRVSLDEIREKLEDSCNNEGERIKLREVIKEIKERNATISSLGEHTETQILQNVYASCQDKPDTLNALKQNLLDCIEGGNVVCPTGTTSRIIYSKFVDDVEKIPKTETIINQEIYGIASVVMNEIDTEDESEFKLSFYTKIKGRLTDEYYDILTPEEIESKATNLTRDLY